MSGYHMTPDEFRKHGHEMVDWVADYLAGVEEYPVNSQVAPGEIRDALPTAAPEHPEPLNSGSSDQDRWLRPLHLS